MQNEKELEFRLRHVMSSLNYISKDIIYHSGKQPEKDKKLSFEEELKKENKKRNF